MCILLSTEAITNGDKYKILKRAARVTWPAAVCAVVPLSGMPHA